MKSHVFHDTNPWQTMLQDQHIHRVNEWEREREWKKPHRLNASTNLHSNWLSGVNVVCFCTYLYISPSLSLFTTFIVNNLSCLRCTWKVFIHLIQWARLTISIESLLFFWIWIYTGTICYCCCCFFLVYSFPSSFFNPFIIIRFRQYSANNQTRNLTHFFIMKAKTCYHFWYIDFISNGKLVAL